MSNKTRKHIYTKTNNKLHDAMIERINKELNLEHRKDALHFRTQHDGTKHEGDFYLRLLVDSYGVHFDDFSIDDFKKQKFAENCTVSVIPVEEFGDTLLIEITKYMAEL